MGLPKTLQADLDHRARIQARIRLAWIPTKGCKPTWIIASASKLGVGLLGYPALKLRADWEHLKPKTPHGCRAAGPLTDYAYAIRRFLVAGRGSPAASRRQTCPEPCPELSNSDLPELTLTGISGPYIREIACKEVSFNPKVVGSIPTGGIGKCQRLVVVLRDEVDDRFSRRREPARRGRVAQRTPLPALPYSVRVVMAPGGPARVLIVAHRTAATAAVPERGPCPSCSTMPSSGSPPAPLAPAALLQRHEGFRPGQRSRRTEDRPARRRAGRIRRHAPRREIGKCSRHVDGG